MHDLGYFREHLNEFEQMAANRGVSIDFDGFRALDRERRERITSAERLKAERNKAGAVALYRRALAVLDPPSPVYQELRATIEGMLKLLDPPKTQPRKAAPPHKAE